MAIQLKSHRTVVSNKIVKKEIAYANGDKINYSSCKFPKTDVLLSPPKSLRHIFQRLHSGPLQLTSTDMKFSGQLLLVSALLLAALGASAGSVGQQKILESVSAFSKNFPAGGSIAPKGDYGGIDCGVCLVGMFSFNLTRKILRLREPLPLLRLNCLWSSAPYFMRHPDGNMRVKMA
jgi:hypothetical protein